MNKKIKIGLLLLAVMALVLVPEASAWGNYVPTVSCGTCHINPNGGGERNDVGKYYEQNRQLPPADNTPPVITMLGSSSIDVTHGTTYTDSGATALDQPGSVDLTGSIVVTNLVNTAALGPYTVTYNVADAAGNPAVEVVRTVNVVAALDNTPPTTTPGDDEEHDGDHRESVRSHSLTIEDN